MLGRLQRLATGEVRKGAGAAIKAVEKEVARTADRRIGAEIADYAAHFRLTESPRLVEHLARLDEFWGRDVTRQLARERHGHRGGFLYGLVANAEKRGYPDLAGLQEAIPAHWLSRAGCAFCHAHEQLVPGNSIVWESESFVASPNIRQLFFEGEPGGHVMVFAKHHRSSASSLPERYRAELVDTVRQTKRAMEEAYGKPVSIFSNGSPGAPPWLHQDVDTHAHLQLFSGNATVTELVLRETGLGRDRAIPVSGFADYFRLYDQGKLRGKYILTLDASERGHVILIGDHRVHGGLAMRNARAAVGLPAVPREARIDPNPGAATAVAALLRKTVARQADAPGVRAILATAPVPAN